MAEEAAQNAQNRTARIAATTGYIIRAPYLPIGGAGQARRRQLWIIRIDGIALI
jgi:hypothetical protein